MTIQSLMKEVKKLKPEQREKLAAQILSTIEMDQVDAEPSDEVKAELDRRWEEHLRNPASGMTREQFRRKVALLKKKTRA